jgi:hypothetical protein
MRTLYHVFGITATAESTHVSELAARTMYTIFAVEEVPDVQAWEVVS